jgi:hypothetical protein
MWRLAADGNQTTPLVLGKGGLDLVSTKYTLYRCPRAAIKNMLGSEQQSADSYRKILKITQYSVELHTCNKLNGAFLTMSFYTVS